MCFSDRSEKQDGRPGLWLAETFSTSSLKPLKGIWRNMTGSKITTSSTKFVFFGLIGKTRLPPWPLIGWGIFDFSPLKPLNGIRQNLTGRKISTSSTKFVFFLMDRKKQDGRPGLWLAETFSTSPLKPLNGIWWNLTGSKISTSSTKFVLFVPIGKTRWPPWPLIGWDICDFSSETAEWNSTKLYRTKDLNVLYQVCVFLGRSEKQDGRPGQSVKTVAHCTQVHDMWPFGPLVFRAYRKTKTAAQASDWLVHLRLLLYNHWVAFDETLREARFQIPLQSLCFSDWSENQDGRPGIRFPKTFSTSQLQPLSGFRQILTGNKIAIAQRPLLNYFSGRYEGKDGRPGMHISLVELVYCFWNIGIIVLFNCCCFFYYIDRHR